MQYQRELGQLLRNFRQNVKAQLFIVRFTFVGAVAGSDCNRQGINAGVANELDNVFRVGIAGCVAECRFVFYPGQGAQFGFY